MSVIAPEARAKDLVERLLDRGFAKDLTHADPAFRAGAERELVLRVAGAVRSASAEWTEEAARIADGFTRSRDEGWSFAARTIAERIRERAASALGSNVSAAPRKRRRHGG